MSTTLVVIEEWAAHNRNEAVNADKVWAAAYTSSGHYLAVWGRRGNRCQSQTKAFPTAAGAAALFRAKRAEKVGKGYVEIPFGHALFGNIPSFATASVAGQSPAIGGARITLDGVLAELAAVPVRLRRAGPTGDARQSRASSSRLPEIIFAFTQTRVKAELLLMGGRLAEPERAACLAVLARAREAVGHALAV
jgi:predicted DNA-binding WGR domain protein